MSKKNEDQNQLFAKKVWENLSKENVNDYTEKKGKLTYLSWANSWACLMNHYPCSTYERGEDEYFTDGTMSVTMAVTISDGEESMTRSMYLQVLNHRNQPIANPSSHDINNTRMRCLTKCISMFGLGHYIYAGEDLPNDEKTVVEVRKKQPRRTHDEMLNDLKQKMDESSTLQELQMHFTGATKYFKQCKADDYVEKIVEHKDKLKATFELQEAS